MQINADKGQVYLIFIKYVSRAKNITLRPTLHSEPPKGSHIFNRLALKRELVSPQPSEAFHTIFPLDGSGDLGKFAIQRCLVVKECSD